MILRTNQFNSNQYTKRRVQVLDPRSTQSRVLTIRMKPDNQERDLRITTLTIDNMKMTEIKPATEEDIEVAVVATEAVEEDTSKIDK